MKISDRRLQWHTVTFAKAMMNVVATRAIEQTWVAQGFTRLLRFFEPNNYYIPHANQITLS